MKQTKLFTPLEALCHELTYINWTDTVPTINLTWSEMQVKLEYYLEHMDTYVDHKTVRKEWESNYDTWYLEQSSKYIKLYTYDYDNNTYQSYFTNKLDNSKNTRQMLNMKEWKEFKGSQGAKSYSIVDKEFRQKTKKTIKEAFGKTPEGYKNCIPKQFYWLNPNYVDITEHTSSDVIKDVSGFDFHSHYPGCLMGTQPDAKTAKTVEGRQKPTSEYPFAFYLKTGTIAEYKKYDTHNWINNKYMRSVLTPEQIANIMFTQDFEEITILMKASNYNFDSIMKKHYKNRKTNSDSKLVMNSFIGQLHTKVYKGYELAHIAAVTIARANHKMLQLISQIDEPIHICVDGCIYKGHQNFEDYTHTIGGVGQEFIGCDMKIKGSNMYMIYEATDEGYKYIKHKHGAADSMDDGRDINNCAGVDGSIVSFENAFEEIDHWIKAKLPEFKLVCNKVNKEIKKKYEKKLD